MTNISRHHTLWLTKVEDFAALAFIGYAMTGDALVGDIESAFLMSKNAASMVAVAIDVLFLLAVDDYLSRRNRSLSVMVGRIRLPVFAILLAAWRHKLLLVSIVVFTLHLFGNLGRVTL
ncbi:hypothetical protein [Deinococcus aestuarii]|uniref:hypothetical protein n=1 Tax=Deinococcus aestuarii TaxID=2774531 RepID=UPI001C0D892A|nr:hypothetical protein [Deinococcus aestuarii]